MKCDLKKDCVDNSDEDNRLCVNSRNVNPSCLVPSIENGQIVTDEPDPQTVPAGSYYEDYVSVTVNCSPTYSLVASKREKH